MKTVQLKINDAYGNIIGNATAEVIGNYNPQNLYETTLVKVVEVTYTTTKPISRKNKVRKGQELYKCNCEIS